MFLLHVHSTTTAILTVFFAECIATWALLFNEVGKVFGPQAYKMFYTTNLKSSICI